MGMGPIEFAWHGPNGRTVQTDVSGREACGIVPGRYRIIATDSEGQRADVTFEVEPMFPSALIVREYRVGHATTSTSRDGTVEAVGQGLEEGWRFRWSHGVETDGPVLRDVACGVYSAMPLPNADGKAPILIHQCAPARVSVGRFGNYERVEE